MTGINPRGLLQLQLEQANVGQDYWEVDFNNFKGPEKPKALTHKYLCNLEEMKDKGIGLLYVGPNGPGKTTLAMIAMKYLIRARWNVYCTSLGEIIETIQKTWKDKDSESDEHTFIDRCRRADFVLIDDVGKEHRGQSGFVQTVFDNLIRFRVQNRLPTFLTTNLTKSELNQAYGESVMSLLDGKLLPVTVTGDDHRQTELKPAIKKAFK